MCKRILALRGVVVNVPGDDVAGAGIAPPAGDGRAENCRQSHRRAVTVYQGTAPRITREVEVAEGNGLMEFVVSPLPPQTIDSSLYTESSDGIRVLTTRYRTRAVMEDTRAEVRARQDQIKKLNDKNQELQKQLETIAQDLQLLAKLENFTAATMQQLTEKGQLNADSTIKLADYLMDRRNKDGAVRWRPISRFTPISSKSSFFSGN